MRVRRTLMGLQAWGMRCRNFQDTSAKSVCSTLLQMRPHLPAANDSACGMEDLATLNTWAQEHPLHICVDLASAPDGLRQITASKHPVGAHNLFENAGTTDAGSVAPWLLPVEPNMIGKWLPRSYQLALDGPAVTWIFGDLPTPVLVHRLVQRLDVELGDSTPLMLRFFDPRILSELHTCFPNELASEFFSIGSRWAYLNRDAALQSIVANSASGADALKIPVVLNNVEEQALVLASDAGQCLSETLKRWPDDLRKRTPQARFDLAKLACIHSEHLGLGSLSDKVLLLMLAAGEDDAYFSSTKWKTAEHALRSRQTTLQQLLESGL